MEDFRSGFVSLIGKPNVGKSTLLNKLVGEKIAIVSACPQTTRNLIRGIVTFDEAQIIFVDTPGITELSKVKTLLDRQIIRETLKGLKGTDLILFLVDGTPFSQEDDFILKNLKQLKKPVFLVVNKVDQLKEFQWKAISEEYLSHFPFSRVIPVSAKKETNLSILAGEMIQQLPVHPPYYPSDLITDSPERILIAEFIREKIFHFTRQEIPYSSLVKIQQFEERKNHLIYIRAAIYVEHSSQRGILVGKSGSMIKKIGEEARREIETHLGCKIYLDLWVGVKKAWRMRQKSFREIGPQMD